MSDEQLQGQAAVDHIYDAAKRIMEDPHPLVPMAEYFDHVLGTMGFMYELQGFEDLLAQRHIAVDALRRIYLDDFGQSSGPELHRECAFQALRALGEMVQDGPDQPYTLRETQP